jgi:hypothetical protein
MPIETAEGDTSRDLDDLPRRKAVAHQINGVIHERPDIGQSRDRVVARQDDLAWIGVGPAAGLADEPLHPNGVHADMLHAFQREKPADSGPAPSESDVGPRALGAPPD